ncbi:hypothetical protein AX16_005797 [Volvariella volvacea WC 439]|nr:hypothetical protein AX16_005797 [Volvariella volvacea WC 439]
MSSSGQPYTPPPNRYITDFSKALASEVRILLAEVGKLRDERRALQYEIAELMAVKSKHGGGSDFTPGWQPKPIEAPPPPLDVVPAPPPPVDDQGPAQARPGWRVVHKRPERKPRGAPPAPTPAPPPPPPQALPEPPRQDSPAWTHWRPNPLLMPTPLVTPSSPRVTSPPARNGLFGPSTPPPK